MSLTRASEAPSAEEKELEASAYRNEVARMRCEEEHLFFTRYFFKVRQGIKFRVNWHHRWLAEVVDDIIFGRRKNVVINVPPGSSKTEEVVINLIARGLALNPRARFLHLSGSDTLASLNSSTAREIVQSDEFQALWPLKIAEDSNSKKRWNVVIDGKEAGGVYATSLAGQVTGFRAGHMTDGFQGAIIIDDPIKPEEAFSKVAIDKANRKLLTTVKSRKANPDTPIIIIMQRVAENDPSGFVEKGNLGKDWTFIRVPAVLSDDSVKALPVQYQAEVDRSIRAPDGRFSYWPYKEPIEQLLVMERGEGADQSGARISRHVFNSQYQQTPVALGGNIIHGEHLKRYKVLPPILYRNIYADTAQKAKEHNDYSVFEEWGTAADGRIYLIDQLRGRWEGPELRARAIAFWAKSKSRDASKFGQLRKLKVEDASSGSDLIQSLKLPPHNIPIEAIKRTKNASGKQLDKLTRVMDALPYIEVGLVVIPEDAPFTNDFIAECEAFTADDSHDFDDQIDPMVDAVMDLLSSQNKMKIWTQLATTRAETKGKA
jgi:predicted phage terminase large subunit-like protein